jgi:hypothetical protein
MCNILVMNIDYLFVRELMLKLMCKNNIIAKDFCDVLMSPPRGAWIEIDFNSVIVVEHIVAPSWGVD